MKFRKATSHSLSSVSEKIEVFPFCDRPLGRELSGMWTVGQSRCGNVLSVKMNRSSGNARLDESAENAIFKTSPLPFPGEARFYEYLKEFNFVFKPQA